MEDSNPGICTEDKKKEPIFTDKFSRKIKSSKVKYYTISYVRL